MLNEAVPDTCHPVHRILLHLLNAVRYLPIPPMPTPVRTTATSSPNYFSITSARSGSSMEDPRSRTGSGLPIPTVLILHALSFLPPNERALTARFVFREAAATLTGPSNCTASTSQPLPPHAASWAVEAAQQHVRQLPFRHKLQLLGAAACTGSEVNLEVALALLQPSTFPEMLITGHDTWAASGGIPDPDPAVAAMRSGHPQLLGWLLRRCPALLRPQRVLEAAAKHCGLAALRVVWEALQCEPSWRDDARRPILDLSVLDAAAESACPNAVAKMKWVMDAGGLGPDVSTAAAACRSGDVGRLRWLRQQGCQFARHKESLMQNALEHADMAVVQWLVDDAGCELPTAAYDDRAYRCRTVLAASRSAEGLARVLWLQEWGVLLDIDVAAYLSRKLDNTLATEGQVRVVRYLQEACGMSVEQRARERERVAKGAAQARSIPLLTEMRQDGFAFSIWAYYYAADGGDLAMVRWLVCNAASAAAAVSLKEVVERWPKDTPKHSQDLLEAVPLLVGAGCLVLGAPSLLSATVERGDMGLVQYFRSYLPALLYDGDVWVPAVKGGCEVLLEWLAGQLESANAPGQCYTEAASRADKGALAALRRVGVPWGSKDLLTWAVKEGCPVPVLRWLVEQGAPVGTAGGLERAVEKAVEPRQGWMSRRRSGCGAWWRRWRRRRWRRR